MSHHVAHATTFAGIQGSVITSSGTGKTAGSVAVVTLSEGSSMLLDPAGRWAVRLRSLRPERAQLLLQVICDLSSLGTDVDAAFVRRISAYDEAASNSADLAEKIEEGLLTLDRLCQRVTRSGYLQVTERALRRSFLTQLADLPLFVQLGVRTPAYSGAAI